MVERDELLLQRWQHRLVVMELHGELPLTLQGSCDISCDIMSSHMTAEQHTCVDDLSSVA